MKKIYEKPMVLFEDFAMSTNIAGNCATIVDTQGYGTCGIYMFGLGNVFVKGVTGCNDFEVEDNDPTDGEIDANFNTVCYHVPAQNTNLFAS